MIQSRYRGNLDRKRAVDLSEERRMSTLAPWEKRSLKREAELAGELNRCRDGYEGRLGLLLQADPRLARWMDPGFWGELYIYIIYYIYIICIIYIN